jgi:rhodanese-related sulfurtransferase
LAHTDVEPGFVKECLGDPRYQIVDVRTPFEYERYHVPGSVLIPIQFFHELIDMVDGARPVIFLCEHANRSRVVCQNFGHVFKEVYNMVGGMERWLKLGFEFESGMDEKGLLWANRLKEKGYPVDALFAPYTSERRTV